MRRHPLLMGASTLEGPMDTSRCSRRCGRPKARRILAPVECVLLAFSASECRDSNPASPSLGPYAGTWAGTLNDRDFGAGSFSITLDRTISGLLLAGTWPATLGGATQSGDAQTPITSSLPSATIVLACTLTRGAWGSRPPRRSGPAAPAGRVSEPPAGATYMCLRATFGSTRDARWAGT